MHRVVLRPAGLEDLDAIEEMALLAQTGMTSLPKDRDLLKGKIERSLAAFSAAVEAPGDAYYFFVLESLQDKKVVGICSILASVGCDEPFYAYQTQPIKKASWRLGQDYTVSLLRLTITRNGPSEIGSLYLRPDYRHYGLGKLLSFSRFMFMADHRERFKSSVIAEMRGVSTPEGESPFWDAVGAKFFNIPFKDADRLSGETKEFIATLMPRYPIYMNLLSEEAQSVIGCAHEKTVPALNLLLREGFQRSQSVDIFDAGPKISAAVDDLVTVKESVLMTVEIVSELTEMEGLLVAHGRLELFRCMHILGAVRDGVISLLQTDAEALGVKDGSSVRVRSLPFRSSSEKKTMFFRKVWEWYQCQINSIIKVNG